jgi:hypothetical protein
MKKLNLENISKAVQDFQRPITLLELAKSLGQTEEKESIELEHFLKENSEQLKM